ncbi:protein phosphatase [Amycolatopsis antarctica]|uniref:Protein phosphatase n=1 Tax=Amycolatopsis antarctica TaxID=1854586 RepID=A0A263D206_9PSEU|nr:protein phosphatase 2C domain-containing protein [Amycolatopsis antarctica]OZM71526.1 protein phosphatase [Amycolatopsis antarctica]
MTYAFDYAAASDPGRRRSRNEDSAYVSPRLLAVADGIGGHPHGDVASVAAISALAELGERLAADGAPFDPVATLAEGATEAGRRIVGLAERDPDLRGMGTTLTALLTDGQRVAVAHIGDSRAYLLRAGELVPITRDHTLIQSLVDEGTLNPEQVADHPRRSMLLRALQTAQAGEPDLSVHEPRPGDRYLICSDGLTDVVGDSELLPLLGGAEDPRRTAFRLVEAANAAGGPDNVTCVVCDVGTGRPVRSDVELLGAAAPDTGTGSIRAPFASGRH